MARFLGVEVDDKKKIVYGLNEIHGIGLKLAKKIIKEVGISEDLKVADLSASDWDALRLHIEKNEILVEGQLKQDVYQNIRRMRDIRTYKGIRHKLGLPVRGQRTRRNSHTVRGHSTAVGGLKRVLTKT
ncbi:MAG TPA: 30S ribosomal protein S13 [Candidatus Dojkabacteria bacterium]|nr:30S ribosomal protein S13 [Candidatus Dojkabacteria bacterium]HQF36610.1 30S ribosomal protein S13 [Candidatus Dojkabacteria bacterium]